MKFKNKSIIVYVVVSLMFTLYGGCKQDNKQTKNIENTQSISINTEGIEDVPGIEIAKWKYGFGLDKDGNTIYYDPDKNLNSEFPITYFTKSDEEVKKTEGDIIYAELIRIDNDVIYIFDKKKDMRGIVVNEVKVYHIIRNNRNYISKDGKNWEVLEFKNLKETNEKHWNNERLILVYLKCSLFEGEYFISTSL